MPITMRIIFEDDCNDIMSLPYYNNILNSDLSLYYGTTRYISYGYSVVSVDEAPMEEI